MKKKWERQRLLDVAKKLKVSTATVSRALNNRYGVKRETRAKILKAVAALGYQPNLLAKSLSMRKTSTIGVVIPSIEYSFFPELTRGIEIVASENNYQIILCHSNQDLEKERREIEVLLSKRVDGLIAAPVQGHGGMKIYSDIMKRESVPLVLVTRYFRTLAHQYVGSDDRQGGYLAAKHLLDLGHTRIVHLTGEEEISAYQDRRIGFIEALRERGVAVEEPETVRRTQSTIDGGYRTMQELLRLRSAPTAVFAATDLIAVGALRAAQAAGVRVPQDVAIVGFDDVFWTSLIQPSLTSVCQPKREIGLRAMEMLLREIGRRDHETPVRFVPTRQLLEPTLTIRDSSGAPVEGKAAALA